MNEQTGQYALRGADRFLTPALPVYPELVDATRPTTKSSRIRSLWSRL